MKKVLLVAVLMILGSVACYSDSPLWVLGVTDTPPTATFLPTPDYDKYPAQVGQDQVALAPLPTGGPTQAFFFMTRLPEELLPGVRNASGSCEYGSELEVLYIGQQWENFSGSVYLDDMTLIGGDTTETIFDFEAGTAWTLENDGIGDEDESAATTRDIDFNRLGESGSAVDVANNSGVLALNMQFEGNDWEATFADKFETPQDWSAFDTLEVSIFAPATAKNFFATMFIRTSDNEQAFASNKTALNAGVWTTVSLDLSAVDALDSVEAIGVIVGPDPANTYYLVACSGTVGWTNENRIAGPVLFQTGQSAQTLPISERDAPIPQGQPFMIHGGSEPPLGPLPASSQCAVGDVVDVIGVSTSNDRIWYNIRCGVTEGWVTENRLFGPVPLPAQNGIGVIVGDENMPEISLTGAAGDPSDSNPAVGTCAADTAIMTLGFETIEIDGIPTPFYFIQCGDTVGWANQVHLIEIPYPLETSVIVVGPEISTTDTTEADGEEEAADTDTTTTTDSGDGTQAPESFVDPNYMPAIITNEPTSATEDNIAGECPSSSVVQLEDVATNLGLVFYLVTCGDINGWIDARYLPNEVAYPTGQRLWFIEPSLNAQRRRQIGFAIDQTPTQITTELGQCALFQPAEVMQVVFEQRALKRLGFRLYYQISCTSTEGEPIVGWQELELQAEKITTRNPLELLGG